MASRGQTERAAGVRKAWRSADLSKSKQPTPARLTTSKLGYLSLAETAMPTLQWEEDAMTTESTLFGAHPGVGLRARNSWSGSSAHRTLPLVAVAVIFAWLAPSPAARAHDKSDMNGNTAEGTDALDSLSTGASNTAIGDIALTSNTTGSFNTATGFGALRFNTTGASNTATGINALSSNTTGHNNAATGNEAQ
jgi:hypothetical protein